MPRRKRERLNPEELDIQIGDVTRTTMPEGTPMAEDGSVQTEGAIDLEQMRKIGAANADAAMQNRAVSKAVHAKHMGARDVPWNEKDAVKLFGIIKLGWPSSHMQAIVRRVEPAPAYSYQPFFLHGIQNEVEFYRYFQANIHGESPPAKYEVVFSEGGNQNRGKGVIEMPDTTKKRDPYQPTPYGYPSPQAVPPPPPPIPAPAGPGPMPPGYGYPGGPPPGYAAQPPPQGFSQPSPYAPQSLPQPVSQAPPPQPVAAPAPAPYAPPQGVDTAMVGWQQQIQQEQAALRWQLQQHSLQFERLLGQLEESNRRAASQAAAPPPIGYPSPTPAQPPAPPPHLGYGAPPAAPQSPPPPQAPYGYPQATHAAAPAAAQPPPYPYSVGPMAPPQAPPAPAAAPSPSPSPGGAPSAAQLAQAAAVAAQANPMAQFATMARTATEMVEGMSTAMERMRTALAPMDARAEIVPTAPANPPPAEDAPFGTMAVGFGPNAPHIVYNKDGSIHAMGTLVGLAPLAEKLVGGIKETLTEANRLRAAREAEMMEAHRQQQARMRPLPSGARVIDTEAAAMPAPGYAPPPPPQAPQAPVPSYPSYPGSAGQAPQAAPAYAAAAPPNGAASPVSAIAPSQAAIRQALGGG